MKTMRLLLPVAVLLIACGDDTPKRQPPKLKPGEVHVYVDSTGVIELNGRQMSLDSAKAHLARVKERASGVYYTRENPAGKPTPEQWVAFMNISEIGLPIRFESDSQSYQPPQ